MPAVTRYDSHAMKLTGLIGLVAGMALVFAGLVFMAFPPRITGGSLHDSYYIIPRFHVFLAAGLALAVVGGILWRLRKGRPVNWLSGIGIGFLLASVVAAITGQAQNTMLLDLIADQGQVINYVPREPISVAIFGLLGVVIISAGGVFSKLSRPPKGTSHPPN